MKSEIKQKLNLHCDAHYFNAFLTLKKLILKNVSFDNRMCIITFFIRIIISAQWFSLGKKKKKFILGSYSFFFLLNI